MLTPKVFVLLNLSALALLAKKSSQWVDYCNKKLCPNQGKHIRCGNNGDFSEDCTGDFHLESMDDYMPLILHHHNQYRNYVASGNMSCFPAACRMPILTWSDPLAENAEYNVKTCKFAHDPCRSTENLTYVGQNIYMARTSKMHMTIADFIKEAIYLWFAEWRDAHYSILYSFRKTIPQSGHFTLLVNDRLIALGCAFLNNTIIIKQKPRVLVIFTCDYTSTNLHDYPCYYPSIEPAKCCKKKHRRYRNLCDDDINPNNFYWYA